MFRKFWMDFGVYCSANVIYYFLLKNLTVCQVRLCLGSELTNQEEMQMWFIWYAVFWSCKQYRQWLPDCYCGADERTIACTAANLQTDSYSCGAPCQGMFACGIHNCDLRCVIVLIIFTENVERGRLLEKMPLLWMNFPSISAYFSRYSTYG